MPFNLFLARVIAGLVVGTGILLFGTRAEASDWVVLKYSILRESISIPELSVLAQTGELSPALRVYLTMAKKKPEQLRQALTQEVDVNPVILYRVLNSPVGEAVLDQVAQVIYTPGNPANRQALRSALVSSALSDGKITLIETLENYPTSEVQVDGDRIVSIYRQLSKLSQRLPRL